MTSPPRRPRPLPLPPPPPLLFLDVDGPLLPFGATSAELPDGYPTYGTRPDANPLLARLDPALGPRLLALPCELVWATTWMADANAWVAPRIGLPELPVVSWPDPSEEVRAHHPGPALLHRVDPRFGLTPPDFTALAAWLRGQVTAHRAVNLCRTDSAEGRPRSAGSQ
ncbi:HAD domain-containing protein [Streptomyces vinaceus]|uniref:hypothetical protein n=1 Tax=Streptomyces vinaceus TaxID=1960 RepID=UPI00367639DD